MSKVRTVEDKISLAGTFSGNEVTTTTEKDGTTTKGRGFAPELSRQNAEDEYDDKHRGR